MDSKDELLIILLKCGYADVDSLIGIIEMGEELFDENLLYDIIDEYGRESLCEFNNIMGYLMEEIVYRLVTELDEEIGNGNWYQHVLDEHWAYPYTNYMDSHFQLESLDGWSKGESRGELLSNLKEELDTMEKK